MIAAFDDKKVQAADIADEYKQMPIMEKVWTALVTEFVKDAWKRVMIVRAF